MDIVSLAEQVLRKVKESGGNRVYSTQELKKAPISEKTVHGAQVKQLEAKIEKITKDANQSLVEAIFALARTIELKDGKFSPYLSYNDSYNKFYFYGITSLESASKLLAQRWECFSSDEYSGKCFNFLYPEWVGGILFYSGSCGGGTGFGCYRQNRQKCVITTPYDRIYKFSICPEIPGLIITVLAVTVGAFVAAV
jgi:hypothetical protein